MQLRYEIAGGDFTKAGNVASAVKKVLRKLNIDQAISKHIVIALYEGEVNVVAHSYGGTIVVEIDNSMVRFTITDTGPGIEDIEKAMEEGYSTATPKVREMGFGAGMGLANMKKNSDSMSISSVPGEGTKVIYIKYLSKSPDCN
jgi:serine/threonine-protein kinase RsbT